MLTAVYTLAGDAAFFCIHPTRRTDVDSSVGWLKRSVVAGGDSTIPGMVRTNCIGHGIMRHTRGTHVQ